MNLPVLGPTQHIDVPRTGSYVVTPKYQKSKS